MADCLPVVDEIESDRPQREFKFIDVSTVSCVQAFFLFCVCTHCTAGEACMSQNLSRRPRRFLRGLVSGGVCQILPSLSSREVAGQLPHSHLDSAQPTRPCRALATYAAPASCCSAPSRGSCTRLACRQGQSLRNKSRCLCFIVFHAKLSSRAVG